MGRSNYKSTPDHDLDTEASLVNRPEACIDNLQEPMPKEGLIVRSKNELSIPAVSDVSHVDSSTTLRNLHTDVRLDPNSPSTMVPASEGTLQSTLTNNEDQDSFQHPFPRPPRRDSSSSESSTDSIKELRHRIQVSPAFAKQVALLMSRLTIDSSDSDETSSVQSYNESIFDDQNSDQSSVSSLGDNTHTVFVGAFVDLLIRDPSVDRMITRAISDSGIGAERFRRSLNRILKSYSRDLRDTIQQKEQNQQRVVAFISRKTMQASSLLVTRYKERAPKSDNSALEKVAQYLDGLESDDSDSSDDEEPDSELTIDGLETFLLQGKPFKALKWHLRSLVIPNQRVAQVKASAENLLNVMFCGLGLEETFARAHGRVPNFNAWLHLKIDALATSLEAELKAKTPVTEYLRTYPVYISARAVQKLRQRPNVSNTQDPESSSYQEPDNTYNIELRPPQEILEDIMVEKLPEIFGGDFSQQSSWAGILSTKAFRDFYLDLSDAAYPTFISKCRKALKAEIDAEAPHSSVQSEERYLLSILMELQWCSARYGRNFSLSVESFDSVLWFDRLKLAIERSTGSKWSWWPLSPPPRYESRALVQLESLDLCQQFPTAALLRLVTFLVSFPSLCNFGLPPFSCEEVALVDGNVGSGHYWPPKSAAAG